MVQAVAVTACGDRLVSGAWDKTLRVWDLQNGKVLAVFYAEGPIHGCAIAPNGRLIVAGDAAGRVYFLRLEEPGMAAEPEAGVAPAEREPPTEPPVVAVPAFDVFLAHNSQDKPAVREVAEALKRRGIRPWIDVEQIPPGRWFQDVLQDAIRTVKSAAVFLGPQGIGKWQAVELRTFIEQCVKRGIPVIPVLLPGVEELPPELPFLGQLHGVKFKAGLDDHTALDQLAWGITGKKRP